MIARTPQRRPSDLRPRAGVRRAFTLVELVTTLGVTATIMTAIGSVFVLAAKALPTSRGPTERTVAAAAAFDQLAAELRMATSVLEASPTAVMFTVADRDGDGEDELIRYYWSGSPGAPLTRQYNGATPAVLVPSLKSFTLSYTRRKVTTQETANKTWESGEVLLASFTGWSGLGVSYNDRSLSTAAWGAEKFTIDKVSFPADTTRVAITRVSMILKRPAGSTSGVTVGIHRPNGSGSSTPTSAPVGTPATVAGGALSTSYRWTDSSFNDVVFPDGSTKNLVIVVKGAGSSVSGYLLYNSAILAPVTNTVYRWTTDGGASWQPSTNLQQNDAPFLVYGKYQRTSQSSLVVNTYFLGSVTITAQTSGDVATRVDTGFAVLNQPQVPAP